MWKETTTPPRPEGCMGRGRLKNKHFHRKPSQATQLRQHLEMIWAFPTGLITFPSLDRLHPVREWVQTPGSSLFNFRFGPSTGIQSVQLQICCKFRKLKQVPLQRVETHVSSQSSRVEIRTMNVPSLGPWCMLMHADSSQWEASRPTKTWAEEKLFRGKDQLSHSGNLIFSSRKKNVLDTLAQS